MTRPYTTLKIALVAAAILGTLSVREARAQSHDENEAQLTTPLQQLRPGVTEDQIFAELDAHNETRKSALLDYTSTRTYQVVDLKGKVHAEEIGRMEFRAPDQKKFVTTSERGSEVVRRMALNPLSQ